MAKSTFIKLTGIANWAKVFPDNRDMKGFEGAYEDCGGAYTIDLTLDADNFKVLKESGSMKKGTITEDGVSVKFIRKHEGPFKEAGGEPIVVKADNTPWVFEDDGAIGNGSEVEVTLCVYKTSRKMIVGTRLEKVKVLKAVEFDEFKKTGTDDIPF